MLVRAHFRPRALCSNRDAAAKLRPMQTMDQPAQRGRVLTVDDSPVMRVFVTAALESIGYSVEAVDSGYAALAASRLEEFDAVILDVEMPGIDGIAVGRALRRDPRTSSSMIAMHTSLDESVVRTSFDAYDVFLPKPCDAKVLGERIDRMIRDHRQATLA